MINKAVQDAMNDQINKEMFSAYVYLSMSAHFAAANLPGFAHWMRAQANEEVAHAMKLFDFVNERGGRVLLKAIDGPPVEFKSALAIFESAYEHEQKVTAMINGLYEVALKEKDYPAQIVLQWFISEQVEEEKNAGDIVQQLKMVGDDSRALLMLDRELGGRAAEGGE
jgi:ferritin